MQLLRSVWQVFGQLAGSLRQLSVQEYTHPCTTLSGSTIGQHVRHIIESFQALGNGYDNGLVNYESRKRDKMTENDIELACRALDQIIGTLDREDKALLLEATFDEFSDIPITLPTNYHREIAYNFEHTVHHMALIRIGIREVCSRLVLPEGFGKASSTIKYHQQCAQ